MSFSSHSRKFFFRTARPVEGPLFWRLIFLMRRGASEPQASFLMYRSSCCAGVTRTRIPKWRILLLVFPRTAARPYSPRLIYVRPRNPVGCEILAISSSDSISPCCTFFFAILVRSAAVVRSFPRVAGKIYRSSIAGANQQSGHEKKARSFTHHRGRDWLLWLSLACPLYLKPSAIGSLPQSLFFFTTPHRLRCSVRFSRSFKSFFLDHCCTLENR